MEKEKENVKRKLIKGIKDSHPNYELINNIINKGYIFTADEYIDRTIRGEQLPEQNFEEAYILDDFFPNKSADIEKFLNNTSLNRIADDIQNESINKNEYSIGNSINIKFDSPEEAKNITKAIRSWNKLKIHKLTDNNKSEILDIINFLGFIDPNIINTEYGQNCTWISLNTNPIELNDSKDCPVPMYGSKAIKGSRAYYRILCVWDNPNEHNLISLVKPQIGDDPVIVFYFGAMTSTMRKELAKKCKLNQKTFIVIDELLLIYLISVRNKLNVLFRCTLPFTFLEPYTTTMSGEFSPEMFYGRIRELNEITQSGKCIIYGGRQLGKTVFLKYVEKVFHHPNKGHIALWIDLKSPNIMFSDFIGEVAEKLKKLGININRNETKTLTHLIQKIEGWLDEDTHRRILLLLDEADRFIKKDAVEILGEGTFHYVNQFKGLMERTDRRFKVVFTGLHDLFRMTILQIRNTEGDRNPLIAHYGSPICIGPLLNNGESLAAKALIEKPLYSLGYKFEDNELVREILSQTNYYPNLIQLYCSHLLKFMNDNTNASGPPYIITKDHVENVFKDNNLRNEIQRLFNLTLELDLRYQLLALCLASLSQKGSSIEGYSIDIIKKMALDYWAKGFEEDSSRDIFVYLLDEMVGLGVLYKTNNNKYILRSKSIALLLGDKDEIDQKLWEFIDKIPPKEIDAARLRSSLKNDKTKRSPLTAKQEAELTMPKNDISIILGTKAAGIEDLPQFLKELFGQSFFSIETAIEIRDFKEKLKNVLKQINKTNKTIVNLLLISNLCPWSRTWINTAKNYIKDLNNRIRIVFMADPNVTWNLLDSSGNSKSDMDYLKDDVNIVPLKPWHNDALDHWLEDCYGKFATETYRNELFKITGNWPIFIEEFNKIAKKSHFSWDRDLKNIEYIYNGFKLTDNELINLKNQISISQAQKDLIKKITNKFFSKDAFENELNQISISQAQKDLIKKSSSIYTKFGLSNEISINILKQMYELETDEMIKDLSKEDIIQLIEDQRNGLTKDNILQTINWAEELGLIKTDNGLKINPAVRNIIASM